MGAAVAEKGKYKSSQTDELPFAHLLLSMLFRQCRT